MRDKDKTKEQLISELEEMRQRIAGLDALEAERKQVGKALQKSEKRYRLLTDNAADVIWTTGLDMRPTYMSPSITRLLGYSVEEAMVKTMKEVFTPASYEVAMKAFAEELDIEKMEQKDLSRSRVMEFEFKRKDGSIVPVEIGYSFLRGADAQPVEILAIARDITERKLAEEALRESRAQMQAILDGSPDRIRQVDTDLKILWANQAVFNMNPDVLGQPCYKVVANRDKPCEGCPALKAIKTGQIESGEMYQPFVAGVEGEYYYEHIAVPTKDNDGKVIGTIQIIRDITERKQAEEKLRKRNDFIETILDNLPIGLAVNTVDDGVARYLNKAFEKIYGWPKEDLTSVEEFFNHVYPDPVYRKELKEKILSDIASGDAARMKWENQVATGKDGKQRIINAENIPLLEQNMMISTVQDITERKQAEEALRQSEEKLRLMFESATDGIVVTDLNGNIMEMNEAAVRLHGSDSKEKLIGQNTFELIAEKDRVRVMEILKNALEDGQIRKNVEITFLTEDGREYFAEVSSALLKDAAGNSAGFIAIFRDITERKEAEEKIKRAAEEWRTTFDSITDLVSIHDKDFRIIRVNKAFAYAVNMKPKELIGKTCYQVVHGTNEPMPGCPYAKMFETKKPAIGDFFEPHLGIHFEAMASPILDEKGEVMALVHVVRDITERKKAEAERKELEQKAQITSRLATVGEMASGIAHEINNPLTSVIGFAELLMRRDFPEDIKNDLEIIHTGAKRVASIINRLLTFARQRKPERTYANINEIIETTIELRAYELETGNIKVATHLDPDLPQTMADTGQLQQVFLNIILNAETEMKTAHGKGNLVVKTERVADTIRISFKDDGPGIAKENLEKVFDPFFTTREVGTGTGLGLSICHGIVTEHKGRLYVKSQLGKGATFIIELPVVTEARQLELVKPTDESEKIRVDRILVVDDESAVLQFLDQLLTGEGYEVETAETASDALKRIKSKEYGVILLDIKLPDMNGTELYRRLQKIAPSLANRVIFVTGDVMGKNTTEFLAKTKVPYITKPINIEQLMERINSMLPHS